MRRVIALAARTSFCTAKDPLIPVDLELEIKRAEKLEELQAQHKDLQDSLDKEIKFPIKIYGTSDEYEENFSFMAFRMMQYYRIDPKVLCEYFLKVFKGTLYALKANNREFLEEYLEPGLMNTLQEGMQTLRSKNLSLEVEELQTITRGEILKDQCQILENAMIRGLSVHRSQNLPPSSYVKFNDDEESMFTVFTPKYVTEPQKFINPQANKTIYNDFSRLMVMRSFVRIKTNTTPLIPGLSIDKEMLTNEHLCIFENQMMAPQAFKSSYKLEGYMEWLMKWRFGCWRLVDIDNCMLGNPLLKNERSQDWKEDVFKGSKLDRESTISVKDPER